MQHIIYKISGFLLFCIFPLCSVFAQQDPLFPQYRYDKLSLNPAWAGSTGAFSGDISYRQQWAGMEGAPKTLSASFHAPLPNPHLALGINLYNDRIGPQNKTGMGATLAYKVLFPKASLSFGLQGGFRYDDIDWWKISFENNSENAATNRPKQEVKPDVNFGILYKTNTYYIGFSSKHLLENQVIINKNAQGNNEIGKLFAHFYLMGAYNFYVNPNFSVIPSSYVKFAKESATEINVSAAFRLINRISLTPSYRAAFNKQATQNNQHAFAFAADFNIDKNWRIGYAYETWKKEFNGAGGTHEVRLGFDFDMLNSKVNLPVVF